MSDKLPTPLEPAEPVPLVDMDRPEMLLATSSPIDEARFDLEGRTGDGGRLTKVGGDGDLELNDGVRDADALDLSLSL